MKFSKFIFSFLLLLFANLLHAQTITDFPHEEGFETSGDEFTSDFPQGWVVDTLSTMENMFNLSWVVFDDSGHTGIKSAFIPGIPSVVNDDWLISPPVAIKKDHIYTFSFWYRTGSGGAPKIALHLGDEPSHAGMSEDPLWSDEDVTNTIYQQVIVEYTATQDSIIYLGFHAFESSGVSNFLLDDIGIEEDMPTSLQGIDDSNKINIYPNPADDLINISSTTRTDYAEIYSLDGKLIHTYMLNIGDSSLSVEFLSKGAYIMKIYAKNELLATKKFLKMKE